MESITDELKRIYFYIKIFEMAYFSEILSVIKYVDFKEFI